MSLRARYGGPQLPEGVALQKIYDVTKEGDNVNYDYVTLAPSSMYLVIRTVWTISTGRVYGHGAYFVSTPDEASFGTVAATRAGFAQAGSEGITLNAPNSTQLQWRCSNTAYRARLRVYKIV